MPKKFTQKEIIGKFKDKHGSKFDYSKFKYKTLDHKSKIQCIKHDNFFLVSAKNHLKGINGGCKYCKSFSTDEII